MIEPQKDTLPTDEEDCQAQVRFGLLGRTLGHSWSPAIHAQLGSTPYTLFEREPEDVEAFVRKGSWQGLNVTIPYKRRAYELADVRSDRAQRLGVANTLVRRPDGSVYADNTDLAGFAWMLDSFCKRALGGPAGQVLSEKPVIVLGSGGASQAVQAALGDCGARVSVISRKGEDNYQNLVDRHADAVLVVNTTPVGMYPKCPASPLTDEQFRGLAALKGVVDVVYNPQRTGICLQAERAGLPYESGLSMLVGQACRSSEQFLDTTFADERIVELTNLIRQKSGNVYFIGMPGVGKTSAARSLSRLLGRPFIDLDDAVHVAAGITASDYITQHGEDAFRKLESEVTAQYGAKSGLIVACGGGIVTRERNYDLIHQNGTIVLLRRPLDQLSTKGRPLSKSRGVESLAKERGPLYEQWADLAIDCTGSAASDARLVQSLLGLS